MSDAPELDEFEGLFRRTTMSLDYPNRADWLAKRNNAVAGSRIYGRMLRVVPATGKNRDPGLFHEHRRLKGPLMRATGPGSFNEENEMKALIMAGRDKEAAAYYERCLAINYRAGEPQVRWGSLWYAVYQARKAAA